MAEKFDNPNYNPEAGMKYLATHFEMFKPEVVKAMIADAKRKGVKIPPVVEAKARKAGIMNAVRNAKFKVGDKVKFRNLFKPERGEETGVVTGYDTDGSVLIRDDDGIKVKASEKLVRLAKALNACARNKAPEGWWKGKTIFAAFGWGKSVKGKVVSHKGGIIKLEDGTTFKESDAYDLYAINSCAACTTNAVVAKALNAVRNAWADAPDAATAKRDIEQTVRKAAEIAKRRSGAKATYKLTPNDNYWCGYIELTFNTEEEAKKYNPYYLFDELGDNKSILPKWSWAISSFSYQKNGKVVKIFVGRLAT